MSTNSTEGQIMLIIIKTLWSQGTKHYLEKWYEKYNAHVVSQCPKFQIYS